MYFTNTPTLNSIEAIMKKPPYGTQKGGGRFRSPYKYTKKDCGCRLCLYYRKKTGCTSALCPVLDIRLGCGTASIGEAVKVVFKDAKNVAFQKRLSQIYNRKDDATMIFQNNSHKQIFETEQLNLRRPSKKALAALYLLTADKALVRHNGLAVLLDLPSDPFSLQYDLSKIGVRSCLQDIRIRDDENSDIRVKLFADSDIGNSLAVLFKPSHSLEDANLCAHMVENTRPELLEELEQHIVHGEDTIDCHDGDMLCFQTAWASPFPSQMRFFINSGQTINIVEIINVVCYNFLSICLLIFRSKLRRYNYGFL